MRLILLGPPGCGKGTQAKLLSRNNQLEHIGTGDLLRQAIRQQTLCGQQAQAYVDAGQLVPDQLVNDLMTERFDREDRPDRFVLDGYPRTVSQAQALDALLARHHLPLTCVLLLTVDDEEIVRRLSGRWSCPMAGCKATYHTQSNPPRVPGLCDDCGTPLVQRDDDRVDTVRARLVVYHRNRIELIPQYRAQGLLHEVDGRGEIDQVNLNLLNVLRC
jgi:adenylate kinase